MKLTMKTALANTFAVSMAAAVIALPPPSVLLAAIGGDEETTRIIDPAGLPDTLASLSVPSPDEPDTEISFSADHARAALAECSFYLDRAQNPDTSTCRSVIEATHATFIEPAAYGPPAEDVVPSPDLTEAMILASAQLCRAEWRDAPDPSMFDLSGCISSTTALVRGAD